MRWKVPENRKLVLEALHEAGREDLVDPFFRALKRGGPPRRTPVRKSAPEGDDEPMDDLDTCG